MYEFCYLYDCKGFSILLFLPRWQSGIVHRTMRVQDDFVDVIHFLRNQDNLLCCGHIIFLSYSH